MGPEWQPIATAPKDGRRIIGCKPGWVSAWNFHFAERYNVWRKEGGCVSPFQQPTLWQPWPEPPSDKENAPVASE